MEYKLDYKELHSMCKKVHDQSDDWLRQIRKINADVNAISNTSNVTGEGADSFKQYFNVVHENNLKMLYALIKLHRENCIAYEHDYLTNVSGDRKTHVETAEIKSIKEKLEMQRGINERLHNEIVSTMNSLKGIMTVYYPDEERINDARTRVSTLIDTLNKAIRTVEKTHTANDFDTTHQMIESLKSIISANISKGRSFNNFNVDEYMSSTEYADLVAANGMFVAEYTAKQDVYIRANDSYENLEAAYRAEREKTAVLMRIGVVLATTAVAIVGTAVCGPVVGPIIVGGVNGMISSAANTAIDAYVEDGEIDKADWEEIKYEGIKGAVVGTITGTVSSAVGVGLDVVADDLLAVPLSSQNEIIRLGTGGITGSAKKIVSGALERGVEETLNQVADNIYKGEKITAYKIYDKMFDGKKIAEDGVFGGFDGSLKESKRLDKEQLKGAPTREQLKNRGESLHSYEKAEYKKKKEKEPYFERVKEELHKGFPTKVKDIDADTVKKAMKTEYKISDLIIEATADSGKNDHNKSSNGGGFR